MALLIERVSPPLHLSYGVIFFSSFSLRRNLWLLNAVYTHKTNTAVNLHLAFFLFVLHHHCIAP